jgi:hypothetical protein
MALTVTESIAVNKLLRWLLPADPDSGISRPTSEEAEAAAALLADRANDRLMAGLNGNRVRDAWPRKGGRR